MERGPAGNTSLAAAFAIAQEMGEEETVLVQETEYTGAGKHVQPQLAFARENGIDIRFGDPREEVPGTSIILPQNPSFIRVRDLDLNELRRSYIRYSVDFARERLKERGEEARPGFAHEDIRFLSEETRFTTEQVKEALAAMKLG